MHGALATIIAYLLGSIPFGYLIVRWRKGIDVRTTGSGATGATNVMRNLGILGFVATLVFDAGKGSISVMLASRLTGNDPKWLGAAAVAAIAGHILPVWLSFRGGKGLATAIGAFITLAPVAIAVCLVVLAVVVAVWRYISLGSLVSVGAFPAVMYWLSRPPVTVLLAAVAASLLIMGSHHANIRRLLNGTEPKVGKAKTVSNESSLGGVRPA